MAHEMSGTDAAIIEGRWEAKCPACGIRLYVQPGQPSNTCGGCGEVFLVRFPADEPRGRIEYYLQRRPDVGTRNWLPGESIAQLIRENTRAGVM
jgi:predicted RNA-binding Zn-ribbon protein involved in translation (DUF1610 family)